MLMISTKLLSTLLDCSLNTCFYEFQIFVISSTQLNSDSDWFKIEILMKIPIHHLEFVKWYGEQLIYLYNTSFHKFQIQNAITNSDYTNTCFTLPFFCPNTGVIWLANWNLGIIVNTNSEFGGGSNEQHMLQAFQFTIDVKIMLKPSNFPLLWHRTIVQQ